MEFTYTAMNADGEATLMFSITVAADPAPTFADGAAIDAQSYTVSTTITPLSLPVATSASGATITYTLTPAIPGLSFDADTRVLSGTPTTAAAAMDFIYTAMNADGVAMLMFSITVMPDRTPTFGAATIADRVYVQDVPIEPPLTLPVATNPTSSGGAITYTLALPNGAAVSVAVPGLAFNTATRVLSGTPTTAVAAQSFIYTAMNTEGTTRLTFSITVAADTAPVFSAPSVSAQSYIVSTMITPLTLPEATNPTSSGGAITYTLTPAIAGLSFAAGTRVLSGTPTTAATTAVTYTAINTEGTTALMFSITVAADTVPVFSVAVPARVYAQDTPITPLTLPRATGGNGVITYTLTPAIAGLSFAAGTRVLSGTPTVIATTAVTYTARDSDGNTAAGDTDTLGFTIMVVEATGPIFSVTSFPAQNYIVSTPITPLTLPSATSASGATITYTLTGPNGVDLSQVPGLSFDRGHPRPVRHADHRRHDGCHLHGDGLGRRLLAEVQHHGGAGHRPGLLRYQLLPPGELHRRHEDSVADPAAGLRRQRRYHLHADPRHRRADLCRGHPRPVRHADHRRHDACHLHGDGRGRQHRGGRHRHADVQHHGGGADDD